MFIVPVVARLLLSVWLYFLVLEVVARVEWNMLKRGLSCVRNLLTPWDASWLQSCHQQDKTQLVRVVIRSIQILTVTQQNHVHVLWCVQTVTIGLPFPVLSAMGQVAATMIETYLVKRVPFRTHTLWIFLFPGLRHEFKTHTKNIHLQMMHQSTCDFTFLSSFWFGPFVSYTAMLLLVWTWIHPSSSWRSASKYQ